jgi:hypothetical protein
VLTHIQCPYTGPLFGPSHPRGPNKSGTAEAIGRAMVRLGFLNAALGELDEHFNKGKELAVQKWQRTLPNVQDTGQYGRGSWLALRAAKVQKPKPHAGEYALDGPALKLILADWKAQQAPDVDDVRAAIADFCLRAEAVEARWHYSQRRPYTGRGDTPERDHVNDCSSYVCLAYFWAKEQTKVAVPDPSGHSYSGAGNTWDDLDGHPKVSGNYRVGDLAHYDGHVTICRKAGDASSSIWSSFGQESGPEARQLFYRDDFMMVVRPPLGP